MISCNNFYQAISAAGVGFYAGVPDSLLKEICACITEKSAADKHIIAANEGAAVGLAIGSYLATGELAMVYMQNSGLGNIVNPLLSLADAKVYSVPMLLMVGWRGEPGVKDEPQHVKQGEVTLDLLDAMGIPYQILPDKDEEAELVMQKMVAMANELQQPTALVVRKNTFDKYQKQQADSVRSSLTLRREEALSIILEEIAAEDVVVSTTGMISREIFEYRETAKQGHAQDFLTVGGMGHCSQIAMGVALSKKDKKVFCIDGDGAVIMHMGSLGISGQYKGGNLIHIVVNNGKHDSVGGQPTIGFDIDIPEIAKACGYREVCRVDTEAAIRQEIQRIKNMGVPSLIEVQVLPGSRPDLGRPTTTPIENKEAFMKHVMS
ncbi:phosphonopyruvate decarboxylase [Persicirhabdus sediminis]|uniref:Phosphonopyruvate decarboxylase n=1 Tax=Persicirhabdus sediminis TaxID=454144 RepID=A0A8J7MH44_9BACT|nr:phosphonopyruvate decarboxylase [Persicirhabdus sediminis]MBK1792766.1 phosphonopyruvate decarboxylase [Persicirhabdus sediminis]